VRRLPKITDKISSLFSTLASRSILTVVSLSLLVLAVFGLLVFSRMNIPLAILSVLAIISCALWIILYRREIRSWFIRGVRETDLNITAYFFLLLAILVIVNLISVRQHFRLDLTSNGIHTLSPQTTVILKNLKDPVEIVFFRTAMEQNENVSEVLKLYPKKSPRVTLQEYDPDEKPVLAKQYDVQSAVPGGQAVYSSIYMKSGSRIEKVTGIAMDVIPSPDGRYQQVLVPANNLERKITSAIIRLNGPKKKIYFLAGHSEDDLSDMDKKGFSRLKNYLIQENYDIDELFLSAQKQIPPDCALLISLGAKRPLDSREVSVIDDYLGKGGRFLAGTDPQSFSGLNNVLGKWGVWFNNDFVLDPGSSYWFRPDVPLVKTFGFSPMTENLRAAIVFAQASSIGFAEKSNVSVYRPLRTSDSAWGEMDLKQESPAFNPEKGDIKGPLNLAVYAEKKLDEGRRSAIAAFGDTDFVNNSFIDLYGNLDLFLNAVNALAEKKELNSIRSRDSGASVMELDRIQISFIFVLCVLLIPLGAAAAGITVFLKRRK
jgi:ABC-type uncharacterized transport system involved in gliding motility auxiliary subunit